jgi:hypothetical protein
LSPLDQLLLFVIALAANVFSAFSGGVRALSSYRP